MPLPQNGTPWPPAALANQILPKLGEWAAWYAGDPDMLSAVYGGQQNMDPGQTGFFASDHGGFTAMGRALKRMFWGEPTRAPDRRMKLHVPLAADLCQASADLLFADEVNLTALNRKVQAAIDVMADDGLHNRFAATAEVVAALGGAYLRVTWDDTLADAPFLTTIDADQALPEFRYDRLVAVTFWQTVKVEGKRIWRHLERHELAPDGTGVIVHGLYQGDDKTLGVRVPLLESDITAPLAALIDADGVISTRSPGLAVFYIPNQRPQRRWRTDPVGKSFGRSDLDGVETLLDSLDEVFSSLIRDIRLGKARVMIARDLLEKNTRTTGSGASWDNDQEIYAELRGGSLKGDVPLAQQIQQVQFPIRVAEHQQAIQEIIEHILRTAGYSAQTFGVGDTGNIRTATEIESRERRSLLTRDRKIRQWRPVIADVIEKLLAVDDAVFGRSHGTEEPNVAFTAGVQETQLTLAQTALALTQARSASTQVRVEMLHPDWDDDAISEEVARITAEEGMAVPPPDGYSPVAAQTPDQANVSADAAMP
jgi:A118 family predicted phage portal protein